MRVQGFPRLKLSTQRRTSQKSPEQNSVIFSCYHFLLLIVIKFDGNQINLL
jgi:hypothetical protein